MTERPKIGQSPRDRFSEAALKEMLAFEKRERDFRRKDLQERAKELDLPLVNIDVYRNALLHGS